MADRGYGRLIVGDSCALSTQGHLLTWASKSFAFEGFGGTSCTLRARSGAVGVIRVRLGSCPLRENSFPVALTKRRCRES
jgi:hypothetical protein